MADNNYDFDSAAVRRAAKQVLDCADIVSVNAQPKLKTIRCEIDDSIKGMAADALSERITDIDNDVRSIVNGLRALGNSLTSYAEALERKARELADALK